MAFMIESADELVTYLKDFTGSSNDEEIKQCIFQSELAMRNVELPALRSDPYNSNYIGTVGANGLLPIPADMNKPILFFIQGNTGETSSTGPWIVYDRVGDRDILTMSLVSQFWLNPVNVPAVIRGKFSEVGSNYQFVPYLNEGSLVNMYYYRAFNFLFTPTSSVISTTGTVGNISGSGSSFTAEITGMSTTTGLTAGDEISATAGTGSIGVGTITVDSVDSSTQITIAVSGTTPTEGTVTNVSLLGTVQSNEVLASWPEGYVYGALHEYYIKRHNSEDAAVYKAKFDDALRNVEEQNNRGKWSGGNTRLTSVFQPRRGKLYTVK